MGHLSSGERTAGAGFVYINVGGREFGAYQQGWTWYCEGPDGVLVSSKLGAWDIERKIKNLLRRGGGPAKTQRRPSGGGGRGSSPRAQVKAEQHDPHREGHQTSRAWERAFPGMATTHESIHVDRHDRAKGVTPPQAQPDRHDGAHSHVPVGRWTPQASDESDEAGDGSAE